MKNQPMPAITQENEGEVKVNIEEEMRHRGTGVPARMNAIVYNAYGPPDVLSQEEVVTPVPGKDDVLVEVLATSLNRGDTYMRGGDLFLLRLYSGLHTPKFRIPGSDIAGRVAAVGGDVTTFRVGDEVYGDISGAGFGAFAAFARAPVKVLARKPAGLSFEEAAAVPMAATTALHGLRAKGSVQQGQQVLIHGASGGVGTFAVQIARAMGAVVTAVCSTRHVETVRALGASSVIDYTREDFLSSGRQWDRILVVNGNRSLSDYRRDFVPTEYASSPGARSRPFSRPRCSVLCSPSQATAASVRCNRCRAGRICAFFRSSSRMAHFVPSSSVPSRCPRPRTPSGISNRDIPRGKSSSTQPPSPPLPDGEKAAHAALHVDMNSLFSDSHGNRTYQEIDPWNLARFPSASR
jgi:NADPH:quinone reductase-like Zn-dependent oxidoreductase